MQIVNVTLVAVNRNTFRAATWKELDKLIQMKIPAILLKIGVYVFRVINWQKKRGGGGGRGENYRR